MSRGLPAALCIAALVSGCAGASVPNNRIDAPPERWVSAVAERAYMDCMRERGWEPARR